jgi:hypothetical protein
MAGAGRLDGWARGSRAVALSMSLFLAAPATAFQQSGEFLEATVAQPSTAKRPFWALLPEGEDLPAPSARELALYAAERHDAAPGFPAASAGKGTSPFVVATCTRLEAAARDHRLPLDFFTLLIWTESRFDPHAVSPVGAQGIAQFMPYTARERGLADPFDPEQALPKSAHFLRELADEFGNYGLAAAAYNAGPQRVRDWLSGRSGLPFETENYVLTITGHPAQAWTDAELPELAPSWLSEAARDPASRDCVSLVALLGTPRKSAGPRPAPPPPPPPWGVQVAGSFSREGAMGAYRQLQSRHAVLKGREPRVHRERVAGRGRRPIHAVRMGEQTRAAAEALCTKLRADGGSCIVVRN